MTTRAVDPAALKLATQQTAARRAANVPAAAPPKFDSRPTTAPQPSAPSDRVEISSPALAAAGARARRLLAGTVPGPVSFDSQSAREADGPIPLHAQPAATNEAATGVAVGRRIDVQA